MIGIKKSLNKEKMYHPNRKHFNRYKIGKGREVGGHGKRYAHIY